MLGLGFAGFIIAFVLNWWGQHNYEENAIKNQQRDAAKRAVKETS